MSCGWISARDQSGQLVLALGEMQLQGPRSRERLGVQQSHCSTCLVFGHHVSASKEVKSSSKAPRGREAASSHGWAPFCSPASRLQTGSLSLLQLLQKASSKLKVLSETVTSVSLSSTPPQRNAFQGTGQEGEEGLEAQMGPYST